MLNQKVRILIVEDDPDMAELISDLVEAEGWLPTCARSAEEADEILAKDVMQLVLVDHNLPGTSGRTFAQRLRSKVDIGIVMVTAAAAPPTGFSARKQRPTIMSSNPSNRSNSRHGSRPFCAGRSPP